VGIGNLLTYSVPLWQGSDYFTRLKQRWLPYYDDGLRQQRLAMVRHYCLNNLHHIPLYIERGLYFQSFDRLYNAYREFLQALFIARRVGVSFPFKGACVTEGLLRNRAQRKVNVGRIVGSIHRYCFR